MKKAITLPQYSDVEGFSQPSGVVDVQLDKATNRLATPSCPETYVSAFVAGTEPHDTCDQAAGIKGFFSHIFGSNSESVTPPDGNQVANTGVQPGQDPSQHKKKGFFGKILDVFK
jgi:penicillin-binding protein 1B